MGSNKYCEAVCSIAFITWKAQYLLQSGYPESSIPLVQIRWRKLSRHIPVSEAMIGVDFYLEPETGQGLRIWRSGFMNKTSETM